MMTCRPSLRMRLWLGAAVLALLAMIAAAIVVWGLRQVQSHASEAIEAQRRIEAYTNLSLRVGDWMLGLHAPIGVAMANAPPAIPDSLPIMRALDDIDRLIEADVAAAHTQVEANIRARQSLTVARLRVMFRQLGATLTRDPPSTAAGQAALAFHAAQSPGMIRTQIELETRRRDQALAQMEALKRPLLMSAAGIALTAPIVLILLYMIVLRPLFRRLSDAARFAPRMAMGDLPPGAAGHDELGLMFARLRQQAGRIRRRGQQLEAEVEHRTAELSAANRRLAQIDQSRKRFFADVGHELRTPLTVIMGEAELGAAHPDTQTRASFATIGTRAERLFRRIEDLLRIARSDSGQLELSLGKVDLNATARAALADLQPVLRRAKIDTQIDIPPLYVASDADWLRQVFAGLYENAAKYAGAGAVVRIEAEVRGDQVQVTIHDNGPGLPQDMGAKIFDRFSHQPDAPGFGVGLALARWVVETSGGSMHLISARPGLTLALRLPIWRDV